MASSSLGLSIGTENVDLVQLTGTSQRPRLVSCHRVPLRRDSAWRMHLRAEEGEPQGPLVAGTTAFDGGSDQEIVQLVRSLLKRSGISSSGVYAAIASEAVVIRYFQMPVIPVHERRMAVTFEAKKYLPFKLEELITDFQVVIRKNEPSVMRVMFVGIKKNSVTAILSLLQAVGVKPFCLEASPMSLMRLVRYSGQVPRGKVALILSVEQDTATINITQDDLLYLSRNVTVLSPSQQLWEAIVQETRISVDYYRRRFMGEPDLEKVLLYGKEIDQKKVEGLATALDLPIEIGDPFKQIGRTRDVLPGLAVATGLALRGLEKKGSVGTNLIPHEGPQQPLGLLKPFLIQSCCALALLGIGYFLSFENNQVFEQRIASLRQSQVYPPGLKSQMSLVELKLFRDNQQKEGHFLRELLKERGRSVTILSELTRLLPQEAWLQNISFENTLRQPREGSGLPTGSTRTLRLQGGAYEGNRDKELEEINNFLGALKSNKVFHAAFYEFNLDSVQRSHFKDEEVTEFRFSCTSKEGT